MLHTSIVQLNIVANLIKTIVYTSYSLTVNLNIDTSLVGIDALRAEILTLKAQIIIHSQQIFKGLVHVE